MKYQIITLLLREFQDAVGRSVRPDIIAIWQRTLVPRHLDAEFTRRDQPTPPVETINDVT